MEWESCWELFWGELKMKNECIFAFLHFLRKTYFYSSSLCVQYVYTINCYIHSSNHNFCIFSSSIFQTKTLLKLLQANFIFHSWFLHFSLFNNFSDFILSNWSKTRHFIIRIYFLIHVCNNHFDSIDFNREHIFFHLIHFHQTMKMKE